MDDPPKLESDVHDLLDEANLLMLARVPNPVKVRRLIAQMRDVAEQVKAVGASYKEAEQRLRHAAVALEQKIGGPES